MKMRLIFKGIKGQFTCTCTFCIILIFWAGGMHVQIHVHVEL